MSKRLLTILLFVMGFVSPLAAQDTFLWDFNDGTPFDSNAGVGAFMSVTAGSQTITMTTVDVQAPVYVDNGNGLEWDGVTYALAATNILGSLNALAVNNQGPNPFSNEFQDFNEGEFWKMEFDTNVLVTEIDFSSLNNNDTFEILVEGDGSPTIFDAATAPPGETYALPLGLRVIPAGTDLTFMAGLGSGVTVRIPYIVAIPLDGIIESVASGAAESGATWDSGQPAMAGNLYRVVNGDAVSINASFPGIGLVVEDGSIDLATGTLDVSSLVIEEGSTLSNSATGDITLGDVNSLPTMTNNGVVNITASASGNFFLDYDISGTGEFNFQSNGADSDLWLSAAEGWGGVIRFNGTGDNVRLAEAEGLSGVLEMNSTGLNTLIYNSAGTGGDVIFNQPGTIKATSDTNRLQAPTRLTANADVRVEMLNISNSDNERRFFMGSAMRGAGNIHVVSTASDPTDIPNNITVNEFESGPSTTGINPSQRHGSFSGEVTTEGFLSVEMRTSYTKGSFDLSANATMKVGRAITSGDAVDFVTPETVMLGDVRIRSGAGLVVGFDEVPSGSTTVADTILQPNLLRLTEAGDRTGSLVLEDASTTTVPIIGLQTGFGYGAIQAEGDVAIDGDLQVVINPPQRSGHPLEGALYSATIGDTFDIITTAPSVPSGDYDRNGLVDQGDYELWRLTFGDIDNPLADGNNDGVVNLADYAVWRDNLGAAGVLDGSITGTFDSLSIVDDTGVLSAAGATLQINYVSQNLVQLEVVAVGAIDGTVAIPEPTAVTLALVAGIGCAALRRRRRQSTDILCNHR